MQELSESPVSFSELETLLADSLAALVVAQRSETVASIAEALAKPQSWQKVRRVDRSLNEPDTYYAIHEQDLQLARDAVAAGLAMVPKFTPFAGLPALIGLLFRYRRKRARISAEQAAVLLVLRKAPPGGMSVADLAGSLPLRFELSLADVLDVLQSLRGVLLENGERSDFVTEHRDVWTARDV